MASWLENYTPSRFDELAMNDNLKDTLKKVAIQANPPHLIFAGPSGVVNPAPWSLIA